jgi:hypothetical protein
MAFDTDETQLFCLQILSVDATQGAEQRLIAGQDNLKQTCIDYTLTRINAEASKIGGSAASAFQSNIERLRRYLGSDPALAIPRWRLLLDRANVRDTGTMLQVVKDRLYAATTLAEIESAFTGAGPAGQYSISEQIP